MCGIFGSLNFAYDETKVKKSLQHRGPDAFNSAHCKNWKISHARLSILDLSSNASQPMEKDGNFIILNGEIYNYLELKNEFPYLNDEEIKEKITKMQSIFLDIYNYKKDGDDNGNNENMGN